jgi:hypothetical protein
MYEYRGTGCLWQDRTARALPHSRSPYRGLTSNPARYWFCLWREASHVEKCYSEFCHMHCTREDQGSQLWCILLGISHCFGSTVINHCKVCFIYNRNYVCDLSVPNSACAHFQWFTNHRHQNRRSEYNAWVTATLLLHIQQKITIDKAACYSKITLSYQILSPYIRSNYGLSQLRRSYGRHISVIYDREFEETKIAWDDIQPNFLKEDRTTSVIFSEKLRNGG